LIIFPVCEDRVDTKLSSDDEAMQLSMLDAPADQKMRASDDAGDEGVTSAEPIAPGPIGSSMPEKSKPSVADQVLAVPPSSRRG
jgi:hypothetical protein